MPEGTAELEQGNATVNEPGLGAPDNLKELYEVGPAHEDVKANDEPAPGEEIKEEVVLTPDQIADAAVSRWEQRQQETKVIEPKKYTDEELDEMFSVFKPTPDLLAKLRDEDPAKAVEAILDMRNGIVGQVMKMYQAELKAALKEQSAQFQPLVQQTEQARVKAEEETFYKGAPDLKPHGKLVNLVFKDMLTSGKKFPTKEAASKAVADEVRAFLKENGISTVVPNNNGTQTNKPGMAVLSKGGAGGGGGGRPVATTGIAATLRELS